MSATGYDYERRHELLDSLAVHDREFDWPGVFAVAERQTKQRLSEAATAETAPGPTLRQSLKRLGGKLVAALTFTAASALALRLAHGLVPRHFRGLTVGAWIRLMMDKVLVLVAHVAVLAGAGYSALLLLIGVLTAAAFPLWVRRQARRGSLLERTDPLTPAPIRYRVDTALGTDGEVLARISRLRPHLADGALDTRREGCGQITLGTDEGSAEIAERFAQLRVEIDSLEQASQPAYRTLLTEHGLDDEHLAHTAARLRAEAQDTHARQVLNAGVVQALNQAWLSKPSL